MKKIILIITSIWIALSIQAQGIQFFQGSYEEALQKARAEKKQIFVDVYTSWCGPCKLMAKNVFPLQEVGDFFNQKFICLQLDAEKEQEHGFFKNYQANGYPSFFWLNDKGELLDTKTGAVDAEKLIDDARTASVSGLNERLKAYSLRWKKGERTPQLVKEYVVELLSKVSLVKTDSCMMDYFSTLSAEALLSEENYQFLRMYMREPKDDMIFRTLLRNADIYKNYEKESEFWIRMYRMVIRAGIIKRENPQEYEQYKQLLKDIGGEHCEIYLQILANEELMFDREYGKAINNALSLGNKYQAEHGYLYSQFFYTLIIAGYFQKTSVQEDVAEKVIELADAALRSQPNKENLLYLAAAHAKRNDYKKAYELLANEPFFPTPMLSNALYPKLGLPVLHREYMK